MLEILNSRPGSVYEEEQRLSPPPAPPKEYCPEPVKTGIAPGLISIIIDNKYPTHALNNKSAAEKDLRSQRLPCGAYAWKIETHS